MCLKLWKVRRSQCTCSGKMLGSKGMGSTFQWGLLLKVVLWTSWEFFPVTLIFFPPSLTCVDSVWIIAKRTPTVCCLASLPSSGPLLTYVLWWLKIMDLTLCSYSSSTGISALSNPGLRHPISTIQRRSGHLFVQPREWRPESSMPRRLWTTTTP